MSATTTRLLFFLRFLRLPEEEDFSRSMAVKEAAAASPPATRGAGVTGPSRVPCL
eukprot:CAMPEP_0119143280 /NCGR_PEP_ID=MMETSP1310-20130426/34080_1 /TAXON_ID=464262 /ORGANISM="Genus nov. species nov., Strain RCC2339" /LENGTH=54 /DNA_ID=CAMNT_0007134897 /DNA_START=68 /DNA_END=232 /DNA_ORIENTATION=+